MSKCELCGAEVDENDRSYRFLKQIFRLFKKGLANWEPPHGGVEIMGMTPTMDLTQYRAGIMTLAGHATPVYKIDGSIEFRPTSLKYCKTKADLFAQIYKDCVPVVAQQALNCGKAELHDRILTEF